MAGVPRLDDDEPGECIANAQPAVTFAGLAISTSRASAFAQMTAFQIGGIARQPQHSPVSCISNQ